MSLSTRDIATNFPNWTLAQCRAYRAGIKAGLREAPITEGYEYELDDEELEDHDLTLYFFRGYADAIGDDARGTDWFDEIDDWAISHLWWEER